MILFSRRQAIAALASALAMSSAHSADRAGPPWWTARRGRARLTLFGQIPLPTNVAWLTPDLLARFDASDEVWLENPVFDPRTAGEAIQKRIALGGPTLGETIGEADRRRLHAALARAGQKPDSLDRLLTWQAYLPLTQIVDTLNGVDPSNIPERELRRRAIDSGKRVRTEWSSMDEIMSFSSRQTLEEQLQLIGKTLSDIIGPDEARRRAEIWAAGDASPAIEANERWRAVYPALTEKLLTARNRRWAERLTEALARNSATFVCVGIGHLIGSNSIQSLLGEGGVEVSSG